MSPFNKINQFPLFFYKMLNDNIEELTLNKVILIWADPNMKVIITNFFFQFFFTLGRGILRPLSTIYKCATRIYDDSNYVGKLVPSLVNNVHRHHFMVK